MGRRLWCASVSSQTVKMCWIKGQMMFVATMVRERPPCLGICSYFCCCFFVFFFVFMIIVKFLVCLLLLFYFYFIIVVVEILPAFTRRHSENCLFKQLVICHYALMNWSNLDWDMGLCRERGILTTSFSFTVRLTVLFAFFISAPDQ